MKDIFIHQGVSLGIFCMQCYPSNNLRLGCLWNSILYLKTFLFWDICGNIINVTPTKLSSNNNPCFDTSIQGENGTHQIKVMGKSATKQTLFLGKLKSKTLAMLTGLYFPKNSKSKVIFYNHTQWTHHVNVIYVRHSHDARCRTSSDLVILCHLYAFSSAYVFNLYTHLGFVLRLNDIFIHQGVFLGIFCMQCYPSNNLRLGCLWNSILYLKTFLFWDICGNIINVTPTKLSSNNNPCFDTSIQGENGTHQIKVTLNSATKLTLFLGKLKLKTLAMLTGLYSPKNSKSKVMFYNHT